MSSIYQAAYIATIKNYGNTVFIKICRFTSAGPAEEHSEN